MVRDWGMGLFVKIFFGEYSWVYVVSLYILEVLVYD